MVPRLLGRLFVNKICVATNFNSLFNITPVNKEILKSLTNSCLSRCNRNVMYYCIL